MQHTIRSIFSWAKIDDPTPPTPTYEYATTLFTDGMLIINENKTLDRDSNITEHGEVVEEYVAPPYEFSTYTDIPWYEQKDNILAAKVGSEFSSPSMAYLFCYLDKATEIDVSLLDTSETTDMKFMFALCQSVEAIDVSGFDTSNVTDMSSMFYMCSAITEIDVSNFDTSNVENMSNMFVYCAELTTVDVSGFDTSSVDNMSSMFGYSDKITTIYAGELFDVSNVTTSTTMFVSCNSLVGGAGTTYDSSKIDKTYARIDNPPEAAGYFTAK